MMIDYNQPITRDHINFNEYEDMFQLVTEYEKSKDIKLLQKILLNPTLFIYMMFRVDGMPLKLYPYQDLIIRDNHRYKYFRAANQIGKSLYLDAKSAMNLLIDHGKGHNEAIVSKSLPQSTFQMRRIKGLLNSMQKVNWKDIQTSSESMSIISVDVKEGDRVKYTNTLICAPCTEGLLGYDLHELNLDEFEFWEVDIAYFFNQIAQPRTYATKGNITIFSNPNGQDSFGADLEKQTLKNGNKVWHTYVFNYLDRPGNTKEEYDELQHRLPRSIFESTVGAVRSLSDRNYFTREEIERSLDHNVALKPDCQVFMFLDVGAKHDQSVLVIGYIDYPNGESELPHLYVPIIQPYPVGYPLSRVVGAWSGKDDDDGWHYVKSVKDYWIQFMQDNITPVLGVDVTGNSGIMPLMESAGLYATDVVFSGPQKSSYYQRFKYFMEKGLLHRADSKEFDYQCSHLIMKKSGRGYLMVHHETEDDLDDVPDSIAGLISLADPKDAQYANPSVQIFWGENKERRNNNEMDNISTS
jgi:hypothetical protein